MLIYDFSTLSNVDFRASLKEHISDYDKYAEEKKEVLEYSHPEEYEAFYPPLVLHFLRTYMDDYRFVRYLLYLYDYIEKDLEVYLIMGTEFSNEDKELILKCIQNCYIRSRHIHLYRNKRMFKSVKGLLTFTSREQIVSHIKTVIQKSPEEYQQSRYRYETRVPYLIISGSDYSSEFPSNPKRTMVPQDEGSLLDLNYQRAFRLLFQTSPEYIRIGDYDDANPKFYNDRIIFLDIDGVLNRDDDFYGEPNHEFYNEDMVKELSRLIRITGGKVILTSSWRYAIQRKVKGIRERYDSILDQFLQLLHRENILIYGMTPDGDMQGNITRPLEIRTWLSKYPEIESFVILEDDTHWDWGYLRQNVVTTITKVSGEEETERRKKKLRPYETRDGLTRELADKAAEILLRKNAACLTGAPE